MEHEIYFWTALVGCTLLLIQVVLQVVGLGGEADADVGADTDTDVHTEADLHDPAHGTSGNMFFGFLSLKALVSFAGIFGLTGLSLEEAGYSGFNRMALALLAGIVAMVVVGYLMRALHHLSSSGTLVIGNAIGHQAQVYLRIPPKGEGQGKVTIELQGRSVELAAVTDGEGIASGQVVQVVEVIANELLKVVPV